jgi:flagellar biosynthesis protein FlhG
MNTKKSSNKVISLAKRIAEKCDRTPGEIPINPKNKTRVISITSGKGGVGKTNIVANLGYALSKAGKRVLIMDADLGLANLDVLLGLAPKYNFSHVIMGTKSINEITMKGPGDIRILPASSGIQELTKLTKEQSIRFLTELDILLDSFDILLIDTAAGISSNVMYFNSTAQEIMVIVSPEPTSITDAYALMKVLSLKYSQNYFKLIINQSSSEEEALEVYRQLNLVAERFLDISIEFMGYVMHDVNIAKSVRQQKIVGELFPETIASKCFSSLAERIDKSGTPKNPRGNTNFFWKHFLRNDFD